MLRYAHLVAGAMLLWLAGCGGPGIDKKPTFPVTGSITVDGNVPDSPIQIECHPQDGFDVERPTVSRTESDLDGKFTISTYESGDGVPPGNYVVTFAWQEFNIMSREYSGKDKLNGRYSDPAKSTITLTVEDGKPTDMGVVALTTK